MDKRSIVWQVLERLDRELVGLKPIKTRIREIAALLLVDRLRNRYGLASTCPTLHMSFTGSPGTGKTTVALARTLFREYLERRMGQPRFANRAQRAQGA